MQVLRANENDGAPFMAAAVPLHPEEQARADLYALIARLLFAPPDADMLAQLAAADPIASEQTDHPLDLAWEKLVLTASVMDAFAIQDEFNELFISSSTPKINPYGSLYLSGFLNEKPLAALRTELARLSLARLPGVREMEDHLGALCETMRVLITGGQGRHRQPVQRQKQFFETHIAPWYGRCLDDLRAADGANFYRRVADFSQAFFVVEAEAFELDDAFAGN
jgi:TorA maturation chaperone TorD